MIYDNLDFLYTSDKKCTRNKNIVQENLILNYCNKPRSLKEITSYFSFKSLRNFKKNYINPLISNSRLVTTIPNNPSNRNQKYMKI